MCGRPYTRRLPRPTQASPEDYLPVFAARALYGPAQDARLSRKGQQTCKSSLDS